MDDTIIPPAEVAVDPKRPTLNYFRSGTQTATSTPFQVPRNVADKEEAAFKKTVYQDPSKAEFSKGTLALAATSGSNIAYSLATDFRRRMESGPADPMWHGDGYKQWLKTNAASIPADQSWRYQLTNNKADADSLLAQSKDWAMKQRIIAARAKDYPISTTIATMLPSLVDIDTPLSFISGGMSLGFKSAISGSRFARVVGGAAAGGAVGAGLGEAGYLADPNADWSMVPLSGLMGMAVGGVGGSFAKANHAAQNVEREFAQNVDEKFAGQTTDYSTAATADDVFVPGYKRAAAEEADAEIEKAQPREQQVYGMKDVQPNDSGGSLGARQVNGAQQPLSTIRSTIIQDTIQKAKTWVRTSGIAKDYFDNFANLDTKYPLVGAAVRRLQDVIHSTALASDFDRMMRSNSAVAQKLAYEFFENASGVLRNNKNGAALYRMYQQQLHNTFKDYAPSLDAWMREQGMGYVDRIRDFKKQAEFNEAVISELQYRKYKTGQAQTNAHILRAADSVDAWSAHDIQVRKGRPGENHEFGTDTMTAQKGYYPQQASGSKMKQMLDDTGRHWNDVVDAITEVYSQMHPAMKLKDRKIWAKALVDRARRSSSGLSMNIQSAIDGDGRQAVAELLVRNGANANDVEKLIDRLTGNMETAGQKGNTKRRIDIDLRGTASNGIRYMDLFDTDVYGMLSRRSHASAGAGAMARKGIASRTELNDYLEAVIEEQNLTSIPKAPGKTGNIKDTVRDNLEHYIDKDKHLTMEQLQDMFSPFTGKPIEGAISPAYQRIIKLTNLGLLGQLGLTQIAEFGPAIAAVGLRRFMKDLPDDLKVAMKEPTSELAKEMKHFGIMEPEEMLFRYDQVYSLERAATEESQWMAKGDQLLNRAQRLQGFTSLMFQVRRIQHKMAVTAGVNRIVQTLAGNGGDFVTNAARLADMGLDGATSARIKKYIQNGTIQMKDGEVHKLNLDKWDAEDMESMTVSVNRFVDQQVQRAMIGESNTLFRKNGITALFMHLKSFPLLAIEKQFMRNVRLADDETMGMFMYGLAMGATAYAVKQTVNGNTDRLNLTDISKGAFNMSNLTGWAPMFIDPTAFLMGFDMPFSAAGGGQRGAISVPPAISYMNQLTTLPGAAQRIVNPFVEASNGDLKALQSFPIAGRMIGVPLILNALKGDAPKKAKAESAPSKTKSEKPTQYFGITLTKPGGILGMLSN